MSLKNRILPDQRRNYLKTLINSDRQIRIIEAHNGLSALVGSTASISAKDSKIIEFDGLWVSSLTCSAAKGLPDTELSNLERRLETIDEILRVTNKPLIVDGDTGGEAVNFEYMCSRLESMGVSAVIIEDKKYPKRNSLSANASHTLENPNEFANKIRRGREVLLSDDFMIFARLESLVTNQGIEDALLRTRMYLLAGADGIMIHSKKRTTDEVYSFLEGYKALCDELGFRKPIICVPTTYNTVTNEELSGHGVDIVIYANHLLRAAQAAMQKVCETILEKNRSLEAEEQCTSISELFEIVGFNDVIKRDSFFQNPVVKLKDVRKRRKDVRDQITELS
ncbi:MAG: phosphoenolpyruvate mutase [Rhizonema sp. PD37]|nr:phosphoenolpyruvate mutase [Rhizonema sp. PD37]